MFPMFQRCLLQGSRCDNGGSKHLWHASSLKPNHKEQQPRTWNFTFPLHNFSTFLPTTKSVSVGALTIFAWLSGTKQFCLGVYNTRKLSTVHVSRKVFNYRQTQSNVRNFLYTKRKYFTKHYDSIPQDQQLHQYEAWFVNLCNKAQYFW
jgi:hypothetical protein